MQKLIVTKHQKAHIDGESIRRLTCILKKYQCHKGQDRWVTAKKTWQLIVMDDSGMDSRSRIKLYKGCML